MEVFRAGSIAGQADLLAAARPATGGAADGSHR
jgi:hypothetical protein